MHTPTLMKLKIQTFALVSTLLATVVLPLPTAFAQGSSINSFAYQGRLNDANGPVNGLYDFNFALFNTSMGGNQIGTSVARMFIPVTNGLFTVPLEFADAASFSGADRWIEIAVRPSGVGTSVTLSPRQQITAAPYAIKAKEAATVPAGTITGAMLADGAISSAKLQSGAALQNILAGGSASVTPGGVVMSDEPTNSALTAQGYVRMPNAEMTLAAEKWTQLNPPAASTEFIPGWQAELAVNTGSELIVFRFDYVYNYDNLVAYSLKLVEVIRYSPTTGQWSKGATPPQNIVEEGVKAVWTGSQVLLWGGEEAIPRGSVWDGYVEYTNKTSLLVYSPALNQWTTIVGTGAIPEGRRLHSAIWTGSRMIVWGGEKVVGDPFYGYGHAFLNTGAAFDPATGAWTALTTNAAPSKRLGHVAVWTGSRMLVYGGTQNENVIHDGASYNPANNTWSPIRSDGSAPQVAFAKAVWTGSEMFVFGGQQFGYAPALGVWIWLPYQVAQSYRLADDVWISRGAPDQIDGEQAMGRMDCAVEWTGTEVIAWGGQGLTRYDAADPYRPYARSDGHAYNMGSGTWRTLPAAPSALTGGASPQSAWLNNQLIVCDPPPLTGSFAQYYANPARAAYSPSLNSWNELPNYFGPAPLKQDDPTAVWTGKEFIIWGGPVNGAVSNRGRRYNPTTGLWTEISTTNAPSARMRHSAVWTGSRMIVWGGDGGGDPRYPAVVYSTGGAYDPATDTWTALPVAPFDPFVQDGFRRTGHKAVWTASGMIVVGGSDGYNGQDQFFPKTIARLSLNLATWTLSSNTDARLARFGHCLGTDGVRQVFLWGGQEQTDQDPIGDGLLIDAFNLSANPVDDADQLEPARNSSVVWSGTEFIVWGGTDAGNQPLGGGSKFNPISGSWTPLSHGGPVLSTTHAGHTAVWSGTEMLLWGGTTNQFGARFNPRNDGWNPMAIGPVMRAGAHGEWTGTNMLVYLPALSAQGSIPEFWRYQPPSKVYFYLKQ
jgi:hypothetical protein